jgi:hypothetical protein
MSEPTTVYGVFEGHPEMPYGYPPNLHGLFVSQELAEQAAEVWQSQAQREKAETTGYRATFDPLYVVPLQLHSEVPPMPEPGNVGLGFAEYMDLHDQGKV